MEIKDTTTTTTNIVPDEASVSSPNPSAHTVILTMELGLLLYTALVARLQDRIMTLTSALSSLNFHLPYKYVARFIVVIKNQLTYQIY